MSICIKYTAIWLLRFKKKLPVWVCCILFSCTIFVIGKHLWRSFAIWEMIDTPMLFVKMSESFNSGDDASQWNIREKVIDCFVFVI